MEASTKEQRDEGYETGLKAERKFIDYINPLGFIYKRPTKSEDINKGWDLKITWAPEKYKIYRNEYIDVKGVKCDPNVERYNWIELITNENEQFLKLGWGLKHGVKFVAFDCHTDWVIVRKDRIRKLIYKVHPFFKKMEELTKNTIDKTNPEFNFLFFNNISLHQHEINNEYCSVKEKTDYYQIYNRRGGAVIFKVPEKILRDISTEIWSQTEILQD